jgi:hypothetical protein
MYRKVAGLAVFGVAALLTAQSAEVGAGAKGGEQPRAKMANYVHTVIFYLKKDAPRGEAGALIKDAHQMLTKIPTVRRLSAGRPAEKATPDVAITDFQVGLLVHFDDYKGLQTYLDHPLHTEYVQKHKKYWEKVAVYDFINQTK